MAVPLSLGLGWVMEWMGTWEVFFTGGRGLGGWIVALVLDALIGLGAFVGSWVGDGLAALLVLVGVL